jgi:hypothetical protein
MPTLGPHVGLSVAAGGAVWVATGEWQAVPVALAAGVLPDADHLVDHYFWYVRRNRARAFFIFHAWEYLLASVAAYVLFESHLALAGTAAYMTHLGSDQIFNPTFRWTYSITARTYVKFGAARVAPWDTHTAHEALIASAPFGRSILRDWFARRE